jgi:predicted lipoprotein with Yx(FWY)xxD motif
LITTKHNSKLGTILACGPKHLTVYLFASGSAMSSELSTIKRADGTTQVTYSAQPLYLYVKDRDDGDAYGQGFTVFGASWHALSSSGKKVDLS